MKKNLFAIASVLFTQVLFAQKPTYTVGVEAITYPPYSQVENKEYSGPFKDILDRFASKNNIQFTYRPLPVARLYMEFYAKELDFKIPSNPYWQQDLKKKKNVEIFYSAPVIHFTDGLLCKKEYQHPELKKIGTVTGFTPWDYLDDIQKKKISLNENPHTEGLLQQAIMERVNCAYINISVGKYYLTHVLKKKDALIFNKNLPHTKSSYHLSTLKHQDLLKKFNAFLKAESDFIKAKQKETEL